MFVFDPQMIVEHPRCVRLFAGADAESSTRLLALEDGKAAGRNQIIGEFG